MIKFLCAKKFALDPIAAEVAPVYGEQPNAKKAGNIGPTKSSWDDEIWKTKQSMAARRLTMLTGEYCTPQP
jgi:hypothetical protein